MSTWPVTICGELSPAFGTKIDQYEFRRLNPKSFVPLSPYSNTWTKYERSPGITITCQFQSYHELGQFHRKRENGKDVKIWIGSNRRGNPNPDVQTKNWHSFISRFGIKVGISNTSVPVYLDFYEDLKVIIRLKPSPFFA